ncbi:MAG TPA: gliding-motility protein MglA [Herpetosiphonaceae bacterium]
MPTMDFATDTIHFKIVYHGPGMSGKASSMASIHAMVPEAARSEFGSYDTGTEHQLGFDCALAGFPPVAGCAPRFHVHTLPGPVLYERAYVEMLDGAHGVVYVADSQRDKLQENIRYLQMLARIITRQGRKFSTFPLVLQYNKRDIPNALALELMDKYLNPLSWPRFATALPRPPGTGIWHPRPSPEVFAPFEALCRLVAERLATTE